MGAILPIHFFDLTAVFANFHLYFNMTLPALNYITASHHTQNTIISIPPSYGFQYSATDSDIKYTHIPYKTGWEKIAPTYYSAFLEDAAVIKGFDRKWIFESFTDLHSAGYIVSRQHYTIGSPFDFDNSAYSAFSNQSFITVKTIFILTAFIIKCLLPIILVI